MKIDSPTAIKNTMAKKVGLDPCIFLKAGDDKVEEKASEEDDSLKLKRLIVRRG